MNSAFSVLMIIAMLLVLGSLGVGLFAMTKGDSRFSNKMMRLRIGLQAVALLLFFLALSTK
ncbi:MAG: twin transmembrane helix small protein [Alphaproteobacteria bacterium]|nr:twin transmembrane helix small protein [Alphaproteobacteria bacterium]